MKRILLVICVFLALAVVGIYQVVKMSKTKGNMSISNETSDQIKDDVFPLRDTFQWRFFLGPVEQISTHTFGENYIDYRMRGKVHSTDYRMEKISYDSLQEKWIGRAEDGTIYVIFFKDIGEDNITLYKHKCDNSLSEAFALERPAADTTAHHGWNTYTREGMKAPDRLLPLSGEYRNIQTQQKIVLDDPEVTWQGKTYRKVTHHVGGKRWVGQLGNTYLLIFYKLPKSSEDLLKLSLQLLSDIDEVYKIKHDQQEFFGFAKTESK